MKTESQTPASAINENSFAALFEESLSRQEMRAGEVITAEVIRIDQNFVVVNAGLKSESFISADEFRNDRGEVEVKVGDYVTVAIEALEDGYGETRLSREKAKRLAAWHELEEAMEEGTLVQGLVNGKVKGGLTVMVNGIRAFLPGSLVDIRPGRNAHLPLAMPLRLPLTQPHPRPRTVVASSRALPEQTHGADD